MNGQNEIQSRNKNENKNENEKCAPLGNENLTLNSSSNRTNTIAIKNVNIVQNINDTSNMNNSQNENENQRQHIYSRFFKVLSMIIEFVFCVAFVVFEKVIKNKHEFFNPHYTGIATISAFFFIFFILFVFEIIAFCVFKKKNPILGKIFFWVSQVFYFIDFFMLPSYYGKIIYIDFEEISDIKKRYISLIVISQIFTLFIIFFDFIVINLYKDLCCEMDKICEETFTCLNNFGKCIKDIISRIICQSKNEEDEEIKGIVQKSEAQKKQINELNGEIKHLLSQYINLEVDRQIN